MNDVDGISGSREWAVGHSERTHRFLGPVRWDCTFARKPAAEAGFYFTRYTDLAPAFRKLTSRGASRALHLATTDGLWPLWNFKGDLPLGVVDQRSDASRRPVSERAKPALEYFSPSVCCSQRMRIRHVPLILRGEALVLTTTARELAQGSKSAA